MPAGSQDPVVELTDGQKNAVDVCLEMNKIAWQQFNQRRDYEFKVTLTVWSALAAAIAGSLSIDRLPVIPYGQMVLLVVGGAVVWVHGRWCLGLATAQEKDRTIALFWEHRVQKMTRTEFPDHVLEVLGRKSQGASQGEPDREEATGLTLLLRWAHLVQLALTVILTLLLVGVNWQRLSEHRPITRTDLEQQKLELEVQELRRRAPLAAATQPGMRPAPAAQAPTP